MKRKDTATLFAAETIEQSCFEIDEQAWIALLMEAAQSRRFSSTHIFKGAKGIGIVGSNIEAGEDLILEAFAHMGHQLFDL
jgi:hypothetical protein